MDVISKRTSTCQHVQRYNAYGYLHSHLIIKLLDSASSEGRVEVGRGGLKQ